MLVYISFWELSKPLFPVQLERPLEVVEPITDMKAKEKSSTTLSCRFSAPPKEVSWLKGGTLLVVSQKHAMKQEAAQAQLIISNLAQEDSGEYRCQSGACESKATLTVEGKKAYISLDLLNEQDISSNISLKKFYSRVMF